MRFPFKKIFFNIAFNSCLFLILIVGIQNSSNKAKVNIVVAETIELPVSFIIGSSFIAGSLFGSIFSMNLYKKK